MKLGFTKIMVQLFKSVVMNFMKKVSYKVSLGGIISALSLFFMFLTGFMPLFVYLIPALAGVMLLIIYVEIDAKWSFFTYVSVAVLCMFITPDKEASLLYVMFLGYYPILKMFIERVGNIILNWLLKLTVYNLMIILYYQIIIRIIVNVDLTDEISDLGKYGALIFLAFTNVVFIVYDIAVSRLKDMYVNWFRKKVLQKI